MIRFFTPSEVNFVISWGFKGNVSPIGQLEEQIPHWKHDKILFASLISDNSLIKSTSKSEFLIVGWDLFPEISYHLNDENCT